MDIPRIMEQLDSDRDAYDADTRDEAEMDYLLLQRELKVWEAARDFIVEVGHHAKWAGGRVGSIVAAFDDKVQEVKGGKSQI